MGVHCGPTTAGNSSTTKATEFAELIEATNPAGLTRGITAVQTQLIALAAAKTRALEASSTRAEIAEARTTLSRASWHESLRSPPPHGSGPVPTSDAASGQGVHPVAPGTAKRSGAEEFNGDERLIAHHPLIMPGRERIGVVGVDS